MVDTTWDPRLIGAEPQGNQTPTVDAGTDQTITAAETASLNGTASDDGLPNPPGALTTTWSQTSGPGTTSFADPNNPTTTATFTGPGTYQLTLTATDGELTTTNQVTITVQPQPEDPSGGETIVLEIGIVDFADDVEEKLTGDGKLDDEDLDFEADRILGLRFLDVTIPKGAVVTKAFIQFVADDDGDDPVTVAITAHDVDSAPVFNEADFDVFSRPRTAESVSWLPAPWLRLGDAGPSQATPDLAPMVQKIIDRSQWAAGNALAFIFESSGPGQREATSQDAGSAAVAVLHIEYSTTP
jgi:hypothetical protein